MKESVTQHIECVNYMHQAGCEWMFYLWPDRFIGFVPRDAFKKKSLRVTLPQKASYPNGTNCSNHTAGRIDVQSVNIATSAVWNSRMGEEMKKTLAYQFNYAKQFVEIGFKKHWDGMLIKLFINCLDDTGKNILNYSATRCVIIKYEGNVSYLTSLPAISPSPKTTKATENKTIKTTTTTTEITATNATRKTRIVIVHKCSTETENVVIVVLSLLVGFLLILFFIIYIGKKKNLLIIKINWKNKNESPAQGNLYDEISLPNSVNMEMSKSDQTNKHYTELSLSQKDFSQANYTGLERNNKGYDDYETASS
ncbi:uncharacterized protein LOC130624936 isoform X2 [Hydractinia symbiolongicarpus]|uniref:uncharacterized protein LOC130624936 isoform X2 n=1 Tax=Hydractinia symbiolongicarpus TaxID=13093 RepID=UPI00254E3A12|nr:uncharacterized protein LOC130624936 isoform X2 [Hydractinia symbiolongicarpus]